MPTYTCRVCGRPVEYEPMPGSTMKPSVCSQCILDGNQKEKQLTRDQEKREHEQRWAMICPERFRLITEGGVTELDRMVKENFVNWPDVDREKPGLLLIGPTGRCKTRWMWRVLRNNFDAGQTIVEFTPRGFEAAYREADGAHKLKSFLDQMCIAGSFFIDDLGKAAWSQNTLETFFEVLDQRDKHLRPVYVTTNYNRQGLADQLKMDSGMMDPLIRRLEANCRVIAL